MILINGINSASKSPRPIPGPVASKTQKQDWTQVTASYSRKIKYARVTGVTGCPSLALTLSVCGFGAAHRQVQGNVPAFSWQNVNDSLENNGVGLINIPTAIIMGSR